MSWRKVGNYFLRGLPLVGLTSLSIREYKKRRGTPFPYYNLRKKEDWKVIGKYAFQIGWSAFFVIKFGVAYKGVKGLINKIKDSQNIEQVNNISITKNNLEKTITYEELISQKDL